ncbi:MAG: glutamate--tRNA ligase, partial [Azospirillaceae bacterium]
PEALRNYLLRLGWGHGDDEIISTEQAVEWFTLEAVGRGPARIDFAKMQNLNGHYIRAADDRRLADLIRPAVEAAAGPLDGTAMARLEAGMTGLKQRAKTVNELTDNALFYVLPRPLVLTDKARQILDETEAGLLAGLRDLLRALDPWSEPAIEEAVRQFAEAQGSKLGKVAQPLRAALTGSTTSPGVFEVAAILGREETLGRLDDAISQRA